MGTHSHRLGIWREARILFGPKQAGNGLALILTSKTTVIGVTLRLIVANDAFVFVNIHFVSVEIRLIVATLRLNVASDAFVFVNNQFVFVNIQFISVEIRLIVVTLRLIVASDEFVFVNIQFVSVEIRLIVVTLQLIVYAAMLREEYPLSLP